MGFKYKLDIMHKKINENKKLFWMIDNFSYSILKSKLLFIFSKIKTFKYEKINNYH
jgi:hypothetical protein